MGGGGREGEVEEGRGATSRRIVRRGHRGDTLTGIRRSRNLRLKRVNLLLQDLVASQELL